MTRNMGNADRFIRLLIVAAIAWLWYSGRLSGVVAIILAVVAVAFFVTSLIGWCPLYTLFRISTRKQPPASA